MKRLISLRARPVWTGLLIGFSLVLAACGPATAVSSPGDTPAASPQASIPETGGEAVQVADNPEFGQILVTAEGMTLYTNTVDTPEDLRCTNIACTSFWPPYTPGAGSTASEEISGSLGTVTRPDGSQQLTYKQQPLYTFYLDKQPGDVKGNGFTDLGGTWHVVTLESAPAGQSTAPPTDSYEYGY